MSPYSQKKKPKLKGLNPMKNRIQAFSSIQY